MKAKRNAPIDFKGADNLKIDARPQPEVVERLESDLIESFEQACHRGMDPIDAIYIILMWAAQETQRVKADNDEAVFRPAAPRHSIV